MSKLYQSFCTMSPVAMAQSSSDDKCNTLYTSGFVHDIMCENSMGQIQIQAWSLLCRKLLLTCQVTPVNSTPGDQVCYHRLPCCSNCTFKNSNLLLKYTLYLISSPLLDAGRLPSVNSTNSVKSTISSPAAAWVPTANKVSEQPALFGEHRQVCKTR